MMDKISSLPDDVLGHILSFLPTEQAALTSILSKRWRNLYVLVSHIDLISQLVIEEHRGVQRCRSVSSSSLKRLSIRLYNTLNISFDVPNLVDLELLCFSGSKYTIVNLGSLLKATLTLCVSQIQKLRRGAAHSIPADMIYLINGIRNVRVLYLSRDALELMYFSVQDLPMFNNLVCLFIVSDKKQGWQILPLLIRNSPNLETLIFKGLEHYITETCGDACVCYGFWENSSCCLSSSRVKVLEICGYQGTSTELDQMKHLLKKLPCLGLVKIRTVKYLQVPIDYLMTFPRASSKCKIQVNF